MVLFEVHITSKIVPDKSTPMTSSGSIGTGSVPNILMKKEGTSLRNWYRDYILIGVAWQGFLVGFGRYSMKRRSIDIATSSLATIVIILKSVYSCETPVVHTVYMVTTIQNSPSSSGNQQCIEDIQFLHPYRPVPSKALPNYSQTDQTD